MSCGEQIAKLLIKFAYGAFRCRVSYVDLEGIEHAANVQAETLFGAVALAVRDFNSDTFVSDKPSEKMMLRLEVLADPREHRLKLQQVERWAGQVSRGPGDMMRRERVKSLQKAASKPLIG